MTASGHALVGAAITTLLPNPAISLPVALFSHFAGDKLPHWDVMTDKNKTKRQIFLQSVIDVLLGFTLVGVIFIYFWHAPNPWLVLLGAFTAQLPDWLEIPYFFFNRKLPFITQNYQIQKWVHDVWFDSRLAAPWGIVSQVVVVVFFIWLSLRNLPSPY